MQSTPLRRKHRNYRLGTTIVESAIVLSICVVLLLGMMEMSIALVRYTTICEAARRVAREAIVHGSLAPPALESWGPGSISLSADGNEPAAKVARETLLALNPAQAKVELRWLEGSNEPDDRVEVTVRYVHQPLISIPGVFTTTELIGKSTMRIAH